MQNCVGLERHRKSKRYCKMIKIDLITGFLGSGKTTFVKRYVKHLISEGTKVGIIQNDFGAVNVDMMLLQELEGELCDIEQIAGGNTTEWKRRFKSKLIAMAMEGFQRIIVEPSGIYDVDEFFDVLYESPIDQWYEIGSVIAIVDANLKEQMSEESEYLLTAQVAKAGKVLLSKTDIASKEQITKTIAHLHRNMEHIPCEKKPEVDIICKNIDEFTANDYQALMNCGKKSVELEKLWFDTHDVYDVLTFMNLSLQEERIRSAVGQIFSHPECGKISRIKGFFQNKDSQWMEVNATSTELYLNPLPEGQQVLIVIGQNLVENKIVKFLVEL